MPAITLESPSTNTMDSCNVLGKTGYGGMAEYPRNVSDSIRDRVEQLAERMMETKGRQQGHEELCAQRYKEILEKISEVKGDMAKLYSRGLVLFIMLLGVALGQAIWPAIFNTVTKFPL